MYKLNRTGPGTDPCGTSNVRCCGQDSVPYLLMFWCLSEKYDLNHRYIYQKYMQIINILISDVYKYVLEGN